MIVLGYIGDHAKDAWTVRLGWALTRLVQRGKFSRCTHVEAVHAIHANGTVDIASASVRDEGVRLKKNVRLNAEKWIAIDVPSWDVADSQVLLDKTAGSQYDWRGAASSALIFLGQSETRWFCNEWVGDPYIVDSYALGPAQFMALALSMPGARIINVPQ
jgi:hypothetical protein